MVRHKIIIVLIVLFTGLTITAQNSEYAITVNTISMLVADDGQCTLIEAINTVKQSQSSGITEGECIYDEGQAIIFLEGGARYPIYAINNESNGLPLIDIELSIQSSDENQAIISRVSDSANFRFFEISDVGQLHLEGISLENGISDIGGAILNEGTLLLENVRLISNYASVAGGAIYNSGTVNAENVEFNRNRTFPPEPQRNLSNFVEFAGGAIFNAHDATFVVSNGLFSNNEARGNGGAIANFGNFLVYDSEFHDNSSRSSGGAIFNYDLLSVFNTYLHNNEGIIFGGAISTTENGNAFISDSRIISNVSLAVGGGIATDGTTSIIRTTITRNSASGWGGGINNHGNLFLIETLITENQSMFGGGIATSNPNLIFLDECCTSVIDNIAEEGADIYEFPESNEFWE